MKKGISLIVLVITIIVMIILAASVVVSLNNTGVINKANHAVQLTNAKQIEQLVALAWADAYADGKTTQAELQTAVDKAVEDNDIDTDKYEITVSTRGVTVVEKSSTENSGSASSGTTTEELDKPTLAVSANTLTITDSSSKATSFIIYVDGTEKQTVTSKTFALDTLGLTEGTHNITVVAKADGYTNSDASTAVSYVVIKFTIAGSTYYTRSGSTWTEWISSSYNSTNATITSSKVYIGSSYVTTTSSGSTAVSSTATITSGTAYGTYTSDDYVGSK